MFLNIEGGYKQRVDAITFILSNLSDKSRSRYFARLCLLMQLDNWHTVYFAARSLAETLKGSDEDFDYDSFNMVLLSMIAEIRSDTWARRKGLNERMTIMYDALKTVSEELADAISGKALPQVTKYLCRILIDIMPKNAGEGSKARFLSRELDTLPISVILKAQDMFYPRETAKGAMSFRTPIHDYPGRRNIDYVRCVLKELYPDAKEGKAEPKDEIYYKLKELISVLEGLYEPSAKHYQNFVFEWLADASGFGAVNATTIISMAGLLRGNRADEEIREILSQEVMAYDTASDEFKQELFEQASAVIHGVQDEEKAKEALTGYMTSRLKNPKLLHILKRLNAISPDSIGGLSLKR